MHKDKWKVIINKTDIEDYIIQRNHKPLNQAHVTTYTVPSISTLLG